MIFSADFVSPPVTHLPLTSREEMLTYASNHTHVVQVDVNYLASYTNFDETVSEYWTIVGAAQGSYPYDPAQDGELGGFVQRSLSAYLVKEEVVSAMKLLQTASSGQVTFMSIALGCDNTLGWGRYFDCANTFHISVDGNTCTLPSTASNAVLNVGYALDEDGSPFGTYRYLLVVLPGGTTGGEILASANNRFEWWKLGGGTYPDNVSKLWFPMEIGGSGRTGRVTVRYGTQDPKVNMQQVFDLETGNLIVTSGVKLELVRTTNSLTLCLVGKVPTDNIAVESSTDCIHWDRIALFRYSGLAWCPADFSQKSLFYRAVAP